MLKELLDRATSLLERRFLKNAFLPVLTLLIAIPLVGLAGTGRFEEAFRAYAEATGSVQAVTIPLLFVVAWFLGSLVASQWRNVIRLYEGYPLLNLGRTSSLAIRWHARRRQELNQVGDSNSLYYLYPSEEDLLPTRLGNILRAGEQYGRYRYGADAILVWPRLYHLLPAEFVSDVEEFRAQLEFLLVVSLWWIAFSSATGIWLVIGGAPPALFLVTFTGGMVLAYAAYVSALPAAVEYAEQIRAGTDLYRLELLSQLRITAPENLRSEQLRCEALLDFIATGGTTRPWRYQSPTARLPTEGTAGT